MRYTLNTIKNTVEAEGYTLISTVFKTVHEKIELKCHCGRDYTVRFKNWLHLGHRCSHGKKEQLNQKLVKSIIESTGYQLLSSTFHNANQKITVWCGDEKCSPYSVKYGDFQQGHRCPTCNGGVRLEYQHVRTFIESKHYKLLSPTYSNIYEKLDMICDKGHKLSMRYNDFQQGHRCPICFYEEMKSKAEKEITDHIHNIFPRINIINNDRSTITNPLTRKRLELDFYFPELNKAIEFNGTYWHSTDYTKFKDKVKTQQCLQKGIDLLVITEEEWINKEKVLENINSFIKSV